MFIYLKFYWLPFISTWSWSTQLGWSTHFGLDQLNLDDIPGYLSPKDTISLEIIELYWLSKIKVKKINILLFHLFFVVTFTTQKCCYNIIMHYAATQGGVATQLISLEV